MSRVTGRSLSRLLTCDPRLQAIVHEASSIMDLSVLCGVRSKEEQEKAFADGASKLRWPNSKHNLKPGQQYSRAVDIIPYFGAAKEHYDWKDLLAFARLAGVMFAIAYKHGVKLRWGGDWDMDNQSADEKFHDLPHFELAEE